MTGEWQNKKLTEAQLQVLRLAAEGNNQAAIAAALSITTAGVRRYREKIMNNLLAPEGASLIDLVRIARNAGYEL